ncbi:MAG TPA: hypothetical protein VE915_09620 [Actinomycetota bacterium]|nr:hypothetical protein [Actinomycetota bacterium]
MQPRVQETSVPILPVTRLSFLLGMLLATVAGIQLYVLSTRTADFFAWTIGVPLTAAFLGAFFWANTPSFVVALRDGEWPRVRILIVATLSLTVFMAIATLRHLDIFHLKEGELTARLAAWAWLIVYVGLPWLLIASFVQQERAGAGLAYSVRDPLLGWVRVYFLLQAVGATILGLGLSFAPGVFADIWPWALPPLPAGAVGAWVLAFAAASWWVLREGDWQRIRIAIPGYLAMCALQLLAAFRFRNELVDGPRTWAYVGTLAGLLVFTATAAWQQERHRG